MQSVPPVLRPEHPTPRPLTEFAAHFGLEVDGALEGLTATGITLATADLRAGEIFVGIHGVRAHGASFAPEAVDKGAVAIVTDADGLKLVRDAGLTVPVLVTDDPRGHLADYSAWVYGTADSPLKILGVTGTNGKTSTVHLQDALLTQLGVVSGMSSSAQRHIAGESITARLTTPESSELHALLALMVERGVETFALEVSVQGIVRHRVDGFKFDVAGFTNLQYDHMDDFKDMDEYLEGKLPMFRADRAKRAVVSLDTPAGARVVETARGEGVPVTTIATPQIAVDQDLAATADWIVTAGESTADVHTQFTLRSADGSKSLTSTTPVIGAHMVANTGIAIVMLLEAGYAWDDIVAVLERDGGIQTVLPGRTEVVTTGRGPVVYLDFGHTPDGFERTTQEVRKVTKGRLITMIGADGSRDTTKRPAMGAAAALNSDATIVTDHHPRWEDAAVIRAGLLKGAREARPDGDIREIFPPEEAIKAAVAMLGPDDALLWFGPGHQTHREIQGVRYPYDPRGMATAALIESGWGPVSEK
ncbi:UDP-N-acetylmuramoyl-L-alanyl-D-glutamate--2,6-diaminopimelate ligase [Gryllotalpicola daejeonensis]|uniref:UDP-N-acetylmuramoyl-L-alanyl-D-glutamate--2, 6-diaminopimelate ligase n=1 Tax=Gryllotalpicola daejeonensis TaxID=993087 RepID=A0ABP7ZHP0_9MICO